MNLAEKCPPSLDSENCPQNRGSQGTDDPWHMTKWSFQFLALNELVSKGHSHPEAARCPRRQLAASGALLVVTIPGWGTELGWKPWVLNTLWWVGWALTKNDLATVLAAPEGELLYQRESRAIAAAYSGGGGQHKDRTGRQGPTPS